MKKQIHMLLLLLTILLVKECECEPACTNSSSAGTNSVLSSRNDKGSFIRPNSKLHKFDIHANELNLLSLIEDDEGDDMKISTSLPCSSSEDNLNILTELVMQMFVHYNNSFGLDVDNLEKFVRAVLLSHRDVPYHNAIHAVSVLHSAFQLLTKCEADSRLLNSNTSDIFAVLVAAFIHDIGQPGNNNELEVKMKSELAVKYENQSVLENWALDQGLELLDKYSLLQHFNEQEQHHIRQAISECVLHTDMIHHERMLQDIDNIVLLSETTSSSSSSKQQQQDQRQLLMNGIVHAADLSSSAYNDFHLVSRWANRICLEFTLQTIKERNLNLQVSSYMEGLTVSSHMARLQVGFLNHVVSPLFFAIQKHLPTCSHFVSNLKANGQQWSELASAE